MKSAELYERDETVWLEEQARLLKQGQHQRLDLPNLIDFLESMARRDRRQLSNRLCQLLVHLLKWQFQSEKRTRSWRSTINHQRIQVRKLLESGALRKTAEEAIPKCFRDAVKLCALETGIKRSMLPKSCPYSLQFLLSDELPESRNAVK